MDKNKELEQMVGDLEEILNLFRKMESAKIKDIESLKKDSILLQEKLKKRYGEEYTPETDSPEA